MCFYALIPNTVFNLITFQSYEGNLNWLSFLGDWGNSAEGCEYEIVTGNMKCKSFATTLNNKYSFFFCFYPHNCDRIWCSKKVSVNLVRGPVVQEAKLISQIHNLRHL